jgi:hypothetical protein
MGVRMKTRAVLTLVVMTCMASWSWASEAVRFEVAQPLPSALSQDCLEIGHVSYVRNVGMWRTGELVELTCAYSAVGRFAGDEPSGSVRPAMTENQNAAALAGLTVRVPHIPYEKLTAIPAAILREGAPWIRPGTRAVRFVDTLDVELDMTTYARTFPSLDSLATLYRQKRTTPDALTACVVDCILDNAAREAIPIRFVRLRLVGAPTLRGFSKTYPVTTPRLREFCEYESPR